MNKQRSSQSAERLASNALHSLPLLVGSRLLTRVISFVVRMGTLRSFGPQQVAFSEVHLALFASLSLLIIREGFKPTSLRFQPTQHEFMQLYLFSGFLVTVFISIIGCVVTWTLSSCSITVWLVETLAIILEAYSDTGWVKLTQKEYYGQCSVAEGISVVSNTLSLSVLMYCGISYWYAVPLSHMTYALVLNLLYFWYLYEAEDSYFLVFKKWKDLTYEGKPYIMMTCFSILRAIPKFLLGDGENMILVLVSDSTSQGNYKFAANLGSLILRFLFRPLEEQAHVVFSRLFHLCQTVVQKMLLRKILEITICSCLCLLGPFFIPEAVALFFGNKWIQASYYLKLYCYYIFIMGMNGLLEAFYTSVRNILVFIVFQVHGFIGDTKALATYTGYTWLISVFYLSTAYYSCKKIGIQGLIISNFLNMSLRSIYCMRLVGSTLSWKGVNDIFPHWLFWICQLFSYLCLLVFSSFFQSVAGETTNLIGQLSYLVCCFVLCIPVICAFVYKERPLLSTLGMGFQRKTKEG
eukprot:jgi/Galph1/3313/GphlegSOOS_G1994.1